MARRNAAVAYVLAVLVATAASARSGPDAVATLAGSGEPGVADGTAAAASFLMPMGLAADAKDTLYVADAAAQRIRSITPGGVVTTLAGSGPVVEDKYVVGGYRDGPAPQAQFNGPSAVAVRSDGTVVVADTLNHCIREIRAGAVSTYAGSATEPGTADGPARTARFTSPKALAFGPGNVLYVADYGVGVRAVSPDGVVSTIPVPNIDNHSIGGIAVAGTVSEPVLFVAHAAGFYVAHPKHADRDRQYAPTSVEGWKYFGYAFAIAAFGPAEAVFTDFGTHAVRYFRADALPYVSVTYTGAVTKPPLEDAYLNGGGFSDGAPAEAQFDSPMGIALLSKGRIAVSDTGNRRIRVLPAVDRRRSMTNPEDLSWLATSRDYKVAIVGGSQVFWNVMWPASIAGRVESQLNADGPRVGLTKHVRALTIRIDAGTAPATAEFVSTFLGAGNVDSVVIPTYNFSLMFPKQQRAAYVQSVVVQMAQLNRTLNLKGTHLLVVVHPEPLGISFDAQWYREYEMPPLPERDVPYELDDALRAAGVPFLNVEREFARRDALNPREPMFDNTDFHFNARGVAVMGNLIVAELERRRPWSAPRPAPATRSNR